MTINDLLPNIGKELNVEYNGISNEKIIIDSIDFTAQTVYYRIKTLSGDWVNDYFCFDDFLNVFNFDRNCIKKLDCECGAFKTYGEKCQSFLHARWCPLFTKEE